MMRSIPQKTGVTIARERERRGRTKPEYTDVPQSGILRIGTGSAGQRPGGRFAGLTEGKRSVEKLLIARGKMRSQVSRKPFEERLSQLQDELSELSQFADEGFDISKLEAEIRRQIHSLEQFLGVINK